MFLSVAALALFLAGCFGGSSDRHAALTSNSESGAPPTTGTTAEPPVQQDAAHEVSSGGTATQTAPSNVRAAPQAAAHPPKDPPGLARACTDDFRQVKHQGPSCHVATGLWKVKLRDGTTIITHGPDSKTTAKCCGKTADEDDADNAFMDSVTARQPVCPANNPHGNYYFVAILAWPTDVSRTKTADSFRSDISKIDGAIYQSAVESGSTNGADLVFACDTSGRVRVDEVQLPTALANSTFDTIISDLRATGRYSKTNEKYLIYFNGVIQEGLLGEGQVPDETDDTGAASNTNNTGPTYAIAYNSSPAAMMHENGHTLGAVQQNSPFSTGQGHCWEDYDIMCYDDAYDNNVPFSGMAIDCPSPSHYDCAHNDYFDAKVGAGQGVTTTDWLASHWNIAGCYDNWVVNRACTTADTTAPTATAPVQTFPLNWQLGTSVAPVTLTWSGSDSGGSGLARYELWQFTDGSTVASQIQLPSALTTSVTRSLDPGHNYRFVVGAVDGAGNRSAWAYGPTFTLSVYQESSTSIAYTGSWIRVAWSSGYGGYESYATAAGASAKFSFTGRNVALTSPMFSTAGRAKIYVDGTYLKTIDLYASSLVARVVVLPLSWSSSASHTLTVTVEGTSGRPRVDVDAFLVAR
jgi:hypothetical protein